MADETEQDEGEARPDRVITYRTGPTAAKFHACRAPVRCVMGPIGSGKSVMCCWDVWLRACEQIPHPLTKERRIRCMVVRNTFTQLQKTTLRTWLDWFPNTTVHSSSPMSGEYRFPHPSGDGTTVVIEMEFRALDDERQIKDLLSLEVTMCWFNEVKEISLDLVQNAMSRTDRYPKADATIGYFPVMDFGSIMDTNPCGEDHWYYRKAEVERPADWAFFRQPPGVLKIDDGEGRFHYEANRGQDPRIPRAENVENYTSGYGYYTKKLSGKSDDWIKVYLMGEYGETKSGKPVYKNYSDAVHYHDGQVEPMWGLPLFLGTDFGRTPSTVIGQVMPDGQIVVYEELCSNGMGILEFCENFLRPKLVNDYKFTQMSVTNFADPAGANGNDIDDLSCIEMMNRCGIPTVPCPVPNNSPYLRWAAVDECLRRRCGEKSGLVICRKCPMLRAGFLGKYCYAKLNKASDSGEDLYSDKVDKTNKWSHPHDALQYLVYGATHQGGEDAFDLGARVSGGYREMRFGMTQGWGVTAPAPIPRPVNALASRYSRGVDPSRYPVGPTLRMAGYC